METGMARPTTMGLRQSIRNMNSTRKARAEPYSSELCSPWKLSCTKSASR